MAAAILTAVFPMMVVTVSANEEPKVPAGRVRAVAANAVAGSVAWVAPAPTRAGIAPLPMPPAPMTAILAALILSWPAPPTCGSTMCRA